MRTASKVPNDQKFPPEINHCINSQPDREQDNYEILGAVQALE